MAAHIVPGPVPDILNNLCHGCPLQADGPARKKRKVTRDGDTTVHNAVAVGESSVENEDLVEMEGKGIALAEAEFRFTGLALDCSVPISPPTTNTSYHSSFENGKSHVVQLQHIRQLGDKFCLKLRLPNSRYPMTLEVSAPLQHFCRVFLCSTSTARIKHSANPMWSFTTLRSSQNDQTTFKLHSKIMWRDAPVAMDSISPNIQHLLAELYPNGSSNGWEPWTPEDFYDNVHVPEKTDQALSAPLKTDLLECALYPFQRRTVRWLLRREGVEIDDNGYVAPLKHRDQENILPASINREIDAQGRQCFVSHLFGMLVSDITSFPDPIADLRGGILAEEMGLGKTVEMIALITLNGRKDIDHPRTQGMKGPKPTSGTLIISPSVISDQWRQEFNEHAPSLKVYRYQGMYKAEQKMSDDALVKKLEEYDVVLTTYTIIAREIHYAQPPPDRNMRHPRQYEPRKSPLVGIEWWRVILDEAQMVESGVSNAAKLAQLIPRCNAWAVSGTPLRKDVMDLYGLLHFLHLEPFSQSQKVFNRLVYEYKAIFRRILGQIALRHTKALIHDELQLPAQKRIVITVPFSAIEEQYYRQLFQQMCDDCFCDQYGNPIVNDFDPNDPHMVERMRRWLTRLRQACLHPEIGVRNRRALGTGDAPLRTVAQVLEMMIEHNDMAIRDEERNLIHSQIKRGQMLENAKQPEQASALWKAALEHTRVIVDECRAQLQAESEKAAQTADEKQHNRTDIDIDEDEETAENKRIGVLRIRLRSALFLEHTCVFFIANGYFQMKSDEQITTPDSPKFYEIEKLETEAYDKAKAIRKEILAEVQSKVSKYMQSIARKEKDDEFVKVPEMEAPSFPGGIESRKLVDKLDVYCDTLNDHAKLLKEWRSVMARKLLESLLDEDDDVELEGDEYEKSQKLQDEIYVYMEALRAMFADRADAINGTVNTLIDHEMKFAMRQAREGEGHAPELTLQLLSARANLKPDPRKGSLRGIITEIRSLITSLQWADRGSSRSAGELAICNDLLRRAQQMSSAHSKVISALEKEVELFRETMNHRLEYYKQLQQISDSVSPYEEQPIGEPVNLGLWQWALLQETRMTDKLSAMKAKARYLLHMREESNRTSCEEKLCVICQSPFEMGILTVCGHQYCKDCLRQWWADHRTCPVCKRHLQRNDFHEITYKPQELVGHEEESFSRDQDQDLSPTSLEKRSTAKGLYSEVSASTLREIKNMEIDGSFGTKIDTISRHLLWLRENDPGSKTIVFSQYKDFLDVLGRAFQQLRIGYSSIDRWDGIEMFKSDPAIEVFLLHARAHSSGLNLINATHVILTEPLINTALELQAIARVHRIGQHRQTTVWMYLVDGTVEEAIYDISVERRLAHVRSSRRIRKHGHDLSTAGSRNESGTSTPMEGDVDVEVAIDVANEAEFRNVKLDHLLAKKSTGGELVDKDDLWECLFGRRGRNGKGQGKTGEVIRARGGEDVGVVGRFLAGEAGETRRGLA